MCCALNSPAGLLFGHGVAIQGQLLLVSVSAGPVVVGVGGIGFGVGIVFVFGERVVGIRGPKIDCYGSWFHQQLGSNSEIRYSRWGGSAAGA